MAEPPAIPTLAEAGIDKKLSALPHYEAEARKRQAHGQTAKGKTLPEKIPEAMDARDHAARGFKVTSSSPSSPPGLRELP